MRAGRDPAASEAAGGGKAAIEFQVDLAERGAGELSAVSALRKAIPHWSFPTCSALVRPAPPPTPTRPPSGERGSFGVSAPTLTRNDCSLSLGGGGGGGDDSRRGWGVWGAAPLRWKGLRNATARPAQPRAKSASREK